ncbi:hypothetical protein [Pseudomonas mosselii]|uniref:hypothetical protein n=1 Tax=Pseudomonas TaxID=286 RepID=UPI0035A24056
MNRAQSSLLDGMLDTDLAKIEAELKQLLPATAQGAAELIILCDKAEIIGETLAILTEKILRSPLLFEISQCLEEAMLTKV